jgi:hypothetical protein
VSIVLVEARRLAGRGGEVLIHEIAVDRASIQVSVEPRHADEVMIELRSLEGVEKVTRVDG